MKKLCDITHTFISGLFPTDERFVKFNGGLSQDQLDWLDRVLTSADEKEEKVTVVSKYSLPSPAKSQGNTPNVFHKGMIYNKRSCTIVLGCSPGAVV